jgi:hypothetical protein
MEPAMRLKIFACHHLPPDLTCNTEIFQTLVSNVPAPEDGSFLSDLGGINIGGDSLYSEMRHQFFVWKNLLGEFDHVGFEHYRRPFFIDPLPAEQLRADFPDVWMMRLVLAGYHHAGLLREQDVFARYLAMRRSLDDTTVERVRQWIGGYDVVAPRPNYENIETQWKSCFDDDIYWNTMVEAVNQSRFFSTRTNRIFFQLQMCYFCNMYIMRTELLDEYLTFCFEVLEYLAAHLTMKGRALGYFSERLFSFWLYHKRIETPCLRVLELPFVMLKREDGIGDPRQAAAPVI